MMQKFQRFGSAMFVPVLLFAFAGIVIGLASLFNNPSIMGDIASGGTHWNKIWYIVEQGAWTVFNQMPLLFTLGIPIALAEKASARATLEALVTFLTFNYFLSAFLTSYPGFFGVDMTQEVGGISGLTEIAGIKTLDTSILGAIIIASITVYLHNKYFDKKLPEFLGIFQGTAFVVILGFFVMIPLAFLTGWLWPYIQNGIESLQGFLSVSGNLGVWLYIFLEKILLPTGLHHFIYGPFQFGPAVIDGGTMANWVANLSGFSKSSDSLKVMFPEGGFALQGNSNVFALPGIALAIYATAKSKKKKIVAGLLIPATFTAIIAGITEPLEFTFIFVAPVLFVIHAFLAATMSTIMYYFGVVGNFGGGLIEFFTLNWLPLSSSHGGTYLVQIIIGLIFTAIYFFLFKFLILKFNFKTPGREENTREEKLYTKADYKMKNEKSIIKTNAGDNQAVAYKYVEALGGKNNLLNVTNCATRLRVKVEDVGKLSSEQEFKEIGAHGLVKNGSAIQVIIGLNVPNVKESIDSVLENQ